MPVIDDLGAGSLVPLGNFGLPDEPTVQQSIQSGASVVTCSGDKLIGGPQAAYSWGRRSALTGSEASPGPALRCVQTHPAGMEATLKLSWRIRRNLAAHHPVYRMFNGRPGRWQTGRPR